MTMQFLTATSDAQGYHYTILLDTTKPTDPNYIFSRDWASAPAGWTGGVSAYQQMTIDEVKALAQHHLDTMTTLTPAPTSLPVHGTTF